MEMHQVRYFLTLCEVLNFTRAAEKCLVSQPSLSRAIRMLEEEFGGVLIHRERGNLHLSELGRIIKPYFEEVYEQAENAKKHALDYRRLKRTPLRIGLMCTIAPNEMLDFVRSVHASGAGVTLQVADDTASELEEQLLNGTLEAAIYAPPQDLRNDRLHYLPLYREQFFIVMRPDHPLAMNNAVKVRDLAGENYLCRINCEMSMPGDRIFAEQSIDCPTVYESERDDWILAMAAAGLGFAFMPRYSAVHPGVVALPMVEPEIWREISLVTVRGRQHSPALGAVVGEAMRARWAGQAAISAMAAKANSDDVGEQAES